MNYGLILGVAITAAMVALAAFSVVPAVAGVVCGTPVLTSLRRLFLLSLVLAIAGAYRIGGDGAAGIYPYELLVIGCVALMVLNRAKRRPAAEASRRRMARMAALTSIVTAWMLWGAFYNAFMVEQDTSSLATIGVSAEGVQLKLFAHLLITATITIAAFWAGATLFDLEAHVRPVLRAIVAGASILSLATVMAWLVKTGGVLARYNFEPPTDLGQGDTSRVAMIGAVCCVILLCDAPRSPKRVFVILGLFTSLAAVVVVQTRQGYLAALVHLAVVIPLCARTNFRRRKRALFAAAAVVVSVGVGALYLLAKTGFGATFTELGSSASPDVLNKIALMNLGLELFLQHPFIGVGRGQFLIHSTVPMMISGQPTFVASPHNGLIELLSETGLPGTILTYAACALLMRRLYSVYKNEQLPLLRSVAGTVLLMVTYVIVISMFQSHVMFPPPVQPPAVRVAFVYWFLAGLVCGRVTRQEAPCESATHNGTATRIGPFGQA